MKPGGRVGFHKVCEKGCVVFIVKAAEIRKIVRFEVHLLMEVAPPHHCTDL